MVNTLVKKSKIWELKSKFFLYRVVSYFSFILVPIWAQKSLELNQGLQALMMCFYIFFMLGQWFLLGKEIDYRLKIYFRVNSSIDRLVYRFFLGMFFFILYFNMLSLLPGKWVYNFFWVTWVVLGLFYSWPTRGKIIQESVTSNFTEYRFLDSFERTLLFMTIALVIFSVPEFTHLTNNSALKLFFDHGENVSPFYWNFLKVNYYPFAKYAVLQKIAWSMHFYVVGVGLFLLTLYALLRFFVSRRLSLLGVFALVSSWSFSKIFISEYGASLTSTYSLLWVWSLLWAVKSSTYRSGLFLGLVGFLGVLYNSINLVFIFLFLALFFAFTKNQHTSWYKKQFLKYFSFGLTLSLIVFVLKLDTASFSGNLNAFSDFIKFFSRKAFYILSVFGILLLLLKTSKFRFSISSDFKLDEKLLSHFLISLLCLVLGGLFVNVSWFSSFSILWILSTLSMFPLELIFQKISRLRSSRNMIYLLYILICLLDSHFEGRVKIFIKFIT